MLFLEYPGRKLPRWVSLKMRAFEWSPLSFEIPFKLSPKRMLCPQASANFGRLSRGSSANGVVTSHEYGRNFSLQHGQQIEHHGLRLVPALWTMVQSTGRQQEFDARPRRTPANSLGLKRNTWDTCSNDLPSYGTWLKGERKWSAW